MKYKVYVETSIIGYLTSWPSENLLVAANQKITNNWWTDKKQNFEIYISEFVIEESSAGDNKAAQERLDFLEDIFELEVDDSVEILAQTLMQSVPLPQKAAVDALHIAVATVNGMDFLLTWNCKHIANPVLRPKIEKVCREHGYEPPSICTPQEIMEVT